MSTHEMKYTYPLTDEQRNAIHAAARRERADAFARVARQIVAALARLAGRPRRSSLNPSAAYRPELG